MNKVQIYRFVNKVGRSLNHNSPKILTALGISGGITAAVMAVKATPNYIYETERIPDIQPKEKAKIFAINYGPSICMGAISVTSILGAQHINSKRIAGLATAYKISETALREYQDKVIEKVGEKKAKQIKDSIIEDRLRKGPADADIDNEPKDSGDYLCYDYYTGKYFYSTQAKLDAAGAEINHRLKEDGDFVALDEFFDLIERNQRCGAGKYMGWAYISHTPVHFNTSQSFPNPNPEQPPILILDYTDTLCMDPSLKSYEDFAKCRY